LFLHAAAVINYQAHADGNVLALEDGKFLLLFSFVNAEIVTSQAVHKVAAVVNDRGMQHHQVYVHLDLAAAGRNATFLSRRGRRGNGHGDLREQTTRAEENQKQTGEGEGSNAEPANELSGPVRSSRSWSRRRGAGVLWERVA